MTNIKLLPQVDGYLANNTSQDEGVGDEKLPSKSERSAVFHAAKVGIASADSIYDSDVDVSISERSSYYRS